MSDLKQSLLLECGCGYKSEVDEWVEFSEMVLDICDNCDGIHGVTLIFPCPSCNAKHEVTAVVGGSEEGSSC
jgi:hypothetical protein